MHLEKNLWQSCSPTYFHTLVIMSLVDVVDCFVFYDDVNFKKERLDQSELCHS